MTWLTKISLESWIILEESAVFILVGFAVAGALHVVLARRRWADWLKGLGAKSVLLASAIGLPLPLCSCGVLPAAVSLRKQGASKGATLSFVISTPETSVQSVLLTYALLGPLMAIYRPIAACITALFAGLSDNFIEKRWPSESADSEPVSDACCATEPTASVGTQADRAPVPWRAGFQHAFIDVFDDVMAWMVLGIVVAAVIRVAVPGYVMNAVFGPPLQAMLIMLVIGVPLYVCAEASTPIAAVLIAQGINPGAALVFLLAGPTTNIGSIGVLRRQLGVRSVTVYLVTIAVVSVAMGLLLNSLYVARGVDLSRRALAEPFLPGWLKALGAIAFLVLCLGSIRRLRYFDRLVGGLDAILPVGVTRGRLVGAIVFFVIAGYAASGLFAIKPGQVGLVKRFGRVARQDVQPGLHYAWPWPVEAVDKVDTRQVNRFELGYKAAVGRNGKTEWQEDENEAWVLLGDENIASIKSATQWHMKPGRSLAFAYSAADRESLVKDAVRSGLRTVLGSADIETVFTTAQLELAAEVHHEAQAILDQCNSGIELLSFAFLDLHAPPEVHEAFRDVASALEDKSTKRDQALTYEAQIVPVAHGTKDATIQDARAYALRTIAEAKGQADSFLARRKAYRLFPALTSARLLFETYDKVLPGLRKCVKPAAENLHLDLRFNRRQADSGKSLFDRAQ